MDLLAAAGDFTISPAELGGLLAAAIGVFGATVVKVWRAANTVLDFVAEQRRRSDAVDVFIDDWEARGITAHGAVDEQRRYRDLTDLHTGAISDLGRRFDEHEGKTDRALATIADGQKRLERKLVAAGVIDRRD